MRIAPTGTSRAESQLNGRVAAPLAVGVALTALAIGLGAGLRNWRAGLGLSIAAATMVPVAISLKGYGPQSRQSRTLSDLFSSEPELTSLEALRVVSPSADGAEFLNRDDEL